MAKGVVSSVPEDMISQGLLDDVDVLVHDARWVGYNFEGKSEERFCAKLVLRLIRPDGTIDEEDHSQYWAAGQIKDWMPDADDNGYTPVKVGGLTGLNNSTNWAFLAATLIAEGLPKTALKDSDMRELIGLRMHMMRKQPPKARDFGEQTPGSTATPGQTKSDGRVLVCTKIIALPGEAAGKAPARATTPATVPATSAPAQATTNGHSTTVPATAAATNPAEHDAVAYTVLQEILSAAPDRVQPFAITAAKFSSLLAKKVTDPATKSAIQQRWMTGMQDEMWLANAGIILDRSQGTPQFRLA
ncbi:MAG: hypothetical protein LC131_05420 [Anaerolineae bacterium]|nr:hypothetical protein [Anaerolineae bacterium]